MAVRTWANSLGIAAGTGVVAGAGQLGIVYGLGIVRWDHDFATGAPWHAQLTWLAFLAMVAVIGGALGGAAQARRLRIAPSLGLRVALAFSAAIGATVVIPLAARPASHAHLAEAVNPRLSAVLVVGTGLLVGIVAAVGTLAVPPVSGSVIATVLWVWVCGLITAAASLGSGTSWGEAELGLFSGRGIWVPVALLVPAVLIALAVSAIARFGGGDLRAVAICGLAGPALVGLAYLIAGPGGGTQTEAYRYALFAVAAGFAVSAVIAVIRRRPARSRAALPAPDAEPATVQVSAVPVSPAPVSPAPVSAVPVSPAPVSPAPVESEPDTGRTRFGVSDYGWPEPEETESDATDLRRIELPPPARPEPAPVRTETAPKPARPAPVPAKKAAPRRGRKQPAATETAPAPPPPPPPTPAPEPAAEEPPKGRLSRRARREAQAAEPKPAEPKPAAAKPGKPPRISKAQAREEDHVDWVRSLGGEDGIRVGGTESARHSKDDDES